MAMWYSSVLESKAMKPNLILSIVAAWHMQSGSSHLCNDCGCRAHMKHASLQN